MRKDALGENLVIGFTAGLRKRAAAIRGTRRSLGIGAALALAAASCGGGSGAGSRGDASTGSSTSASTGCTTDADCLSKLPSTTPSGCATASCNALQGQCVFSAKDEDGDGHPAHACVSNDPGVAIVSGDDCNDHDPNLYPGHPEPCSTSADGATPVGTLCVQGQIRCEPEGTESTCTGTVSCVSSACVSGSCVGSCTPGSTRCSGNGVQTCDAMGSWGSATSCGATATCVSAGASMAQCAGSCASGSTTCGGDNGMQTCTSSGTWGDAVACVNSTCVNGACRGACAPLQTACSGNAVATCSAGESWNTPRPCTNQTCVETQASANGEGGIDAGVDATVAITNSGAGVETASCQGVCAQNAVSCNGQQPRVCDGTGQWQDMGSACDATQTCVNGSCTGACGPTQTRCDGQQPQACGATGQWQASGNACTSSQTCGGGAGSDAGATASCQGNCSPGQLTCSGVQPQACEGTGLWQDNGPACSGTLPACYQGACVVCDPGAGACAGAQPQQCNASGTGWQSVGSTCATTSNPACLNGVCVPCNPGATQCSTGTQAQTCDMTGHWQSETGCVDQTCVGGAGTDAGASMCRGQCAPGQTQCSTSTQPQTCDGTGTWRDATACVNQACLGGSESDSGAPASCQGQCAPGQTQCSTSTQPQTCDGTGTWQDDEACVDQTCVGGTDTNAGAASCQGQCAPGETQCRTGTQPQTCDATGGWADAKACANQTCIEGTCTGSCAPGQSDCDGAQPLTCGSNGQWQNYGAACSGATPYCVPATGCSPTPASCQTSGAGTTNCGSASEGCCTSPEVTGGTFYRTYNQQASTTAPSGAWPDLANPATVSSFRLDKYLVTVGRFRQFVAAWNGGSGWMALVGSGKHTHLNGGQGLVSSGATSADGGVAYETGWRSIYDGFVDPTDANLNCATGYATWTPSAAASESLPITCVNWYEAYAFCIWDGGFLPSDAEWEYAAVGGSQQLLFPWGSKAPGSGNQYAIYGSGSGSCYYPTGALAKCTGVANIAPGGTATLGAGRWGQLDLVGDTWEWGLDWYGSSYIDPCTDCAYLVDTQDNSYRGGSFTDSVLNLLPPDSWSGTPSSTRADYMGFRCARTP